MSFKITKQVIIAGIIGVLFITTLIIIAFTIECPTEFQNQIFKTVMALAAGAFAVMIPGAININYKGVVSASGAIAVFVLVYFFSPETPLDNSLCRQGVDFNGLVTISGKPAGNIDIHVAETGQLSNTDRIGKFSLVLAQSQLKDVLTLYCQSDELGVDTIVYVPRKDLSNTVTIDLNPGEVAPEIRYRGNVYLDGQPLKRAELVMPQLRTRATTDNYGYFEVIPENRISNRDIRMLISQNILKVNESIDLPESELIAYADINLVPFEDTTETHPRVELIAPVAIEKAAPTKGVIKTATTSEKPQTLQRPEEYCLVCMQFASDGAPRNVREKCNTDLKYLKDYIAGYEKASEDRGLKFSCKLRASGELVKNISEQSPTIMKSGK